MRARIVCWLTAIALVVSLAAAAVLAPVQQASAQGTAVSGTWTMTGGTGTGTHAMGTITGGSLTCVLTYSGDISGAFGTFTMTYNPVTGNFDGWTTTTAATITVGGSTYNAQYFASGMAVNITPLAGPPIVPITFTPAGGGVGGTLAGEAAEWFIMGNSTGGTGSGTINFGPTTWTANSVQVLNGTWSGYAYGLAGPPQVEVVPPSSTATATLTVGGQTVATAQHPNSPTAGAIGIFQYDSNPGNAIPALDLGTYVEFSTNIPTGSWTAPVELRIYYTDAQVATAGIDESTLVMYYYNGSSWVQHTNTGVNTAQNYVWAITTHFSPWGIGGWGLPGGGGSGGSGVPVFPSIYIGIGAAMGAGLLAYLLRRKMVAG